MAQRGRHSTAGPPPPAAPKGPKNPGPSRQIVPSEQNNNLYQSYGYGKRNSFVGATSPSHAFRDSRGGHNAYAYPPTESASYYHQHTASTSASASTINSQAISRSSYSRLSDQDNTRRGPFTPDGPQSKTTTTSFKSSSSKGHNKASASDSLFQLDKTPLDTNPKLSAPHPPSFPASSQTTYASTTPKLPASVPTGPRSMLKISMNTKGKAPERLPTSGASSSSPIIRRNPTQDDTYTADSPRTSNHSNPLPTTSSEPRNSSRSRTSEKPTEAIAREALSKVHSVAITKSSSNSLTSPQISRPRTPPKTFIALQKPATRPKLAFAVRANKLESGKTRTRNRNVFDEQAQKLEAAEAEASRLKVANEATSENRKPEDTVESKEHDETFLDTVSGSYTPPPRSRSPASNQVDESEAPGATLDAVPKSQLVPSHPSADLGREPRSYTPPPRKSSSNTHESFTPPLPRVSQPIPKSPSFSPKIGCNLTTLQPPEPEAPPPPPPPSTFVADKDVPSLSGLLPSSVPHETPTSESRDTEEPIETSLRELRSSSPKPTDSLRLSPLRPPSSILSTPLDTLKDQSDERQSDSRLATASPTRTPYEETECPRVQANYYITYDSSLESGSKHSKSRLEKRVNGKGISKPVQDPRIGRQDRHKELAQRRSKATPYKVTYEFDKYSTGRPPLPPPSAILITNFTRLTTADKIRGHFQAYGIIEEMDFKVDKATGGSLCICWIRYKDDVFRASTNSRSERAKAAVATNSQDGHEVALIAVQRNNGTKVSTLTGPDAKLRVELDGQGLLCRRAVDRELDQRHPERRKIQSSSAGKSSKNGPEVAGDRQSSVPRLGKTIIIKAPASLPPKPQTSDPLISVSLHQHKSSSGAGPALADVRPDHNVLQAPIRPRDASIAKPTSVTPAIPKPIGTTQPLRLHSKLSPHTKSRVAGPAVRREASYRSGSDSDPDSEKDHTLHEDEQVYGVGQRRNRQIDRTTIKQEQRLTAPITLSRDVCINIATLKELADQKYEYVYIEKTEFQSYFNRYGKTINCNFIKGALGKSTPAKVTEDVDRFYVLFKHPQGAQRCYYMYHDSELLGAKLVLHVDMPRTQEYIAEYETKARAAAAKEAADALESKSRRDVDHGASRDENVVASARKIIMADLEDAFAKDLRARIAVNKILEANSIYEKSKNTRHSIDSTATGRFSPDDKPIPQRSPQRHNNLNITSSDVPGAASTSTNTATDLDDPHLPSFGRQTHEQQERNWRRRDARMAAAEHAKARAKAKENSSGLNGKTTAGKEAKVHPPIDGVPGALPNRQREPSHPGHGGDYSAVYTDKLQRKALQRPTESHYKKRKKQKVTTIDFTSSEEEEDEQEQEMETETEKEKEKEKEKEEGGEAGNAVQQAQQQHNHLEPEPGLVDMPDKISITEKGSYDLEDDAVVIIPLPQEEVVAPLEAVVTIPTPDATGSTVSTKRELTSEPEESVKRPRLDASAPALEDKPVAQVVAENDRSARPSRNAAASRGKAKTKRGKKQSRKASSPPVMLVTPLAGPLAKLLNSGDREDLFYLKIALEHQRAGRPILPPEVNELDDQEEDEAEIIEPRHNESGSARIEGYYKIPQVEKLRYLLARNQAKEESNKEGISSLSVSRLARANARHLASGLDKHKKATATDTDLLQLNQLRTRKKQLLFARSPIHDWGLYAQEYIPAGEMVIEYVGEAIRQQVADEREKHYERQGIGSSYLFRVDDDVVIDATMKGNLGRLINHCCTPNCTARILSVGNSKKIVIYAKQVISKGDEITYDYHFPIEDEKIVCLCGSSGCRGYLN